MKTYRTNTDICPFINVGTYDDVFGYESLWQDYVNEDIDEGYVVCDDYDFGEFKKELAKSAQKVLDKYTSSEEDTLRQIGILKFHVDGIGSPREYNFRTDWLEFTIDVEDDWLDKSMSKIKLPENLGVVNKFIEKHWHTRDGFISFMPESLAELQLGVDALKGGDTCDEVQIVGGIMMLLLVLARAMEAREGVYELGLSLRDELTEDLLEEFGGNHTHADFMTVVSPEDVAKEFGRNRLHIDEMEKDIREQYGKYTLVMKGNESALDKAENWKDEVVGRLRSFLAEENEIMAQYWDRFRKKTHDEVVEDLHELRRKIDADKETWQKYWVHSHWYEARKAREAKTA